MSEGKKSVVLRDINLILDTIPTFNKVSSLTFNFAVFDRYPFHEYLQDDWAGLFRRVVRISGGNHLKLTLDVAMFQHELLPGELRGHVMERITSLSEYPNICTLCIVEEPNDKECWKRDWRGTFLNWFAFTNSEA